LSVNKHTCALETIHTSYVTAPRRLHRDSRVCPCSIMAQQVSTATTAFGSAACADHAYEAVAALRYDGQPGVPDAAHDGVQPVEAPGAAEVPRVPGSTPRWAGGGRQQRALPFPLACAVVRDRRRGLAAAARHLDRSLFAGLPPSVRAQQSRHQHTRATGARERTRGEEILRHGGLRAMSACGSARVGVTRTSEQRASRIIVFYYTTRNSVTHKRATLQWITSILQLPKVIGYTVVAENHSFRIRLRAPARPLHALSHSKTLWKPWN
jgi:hypothetical protein